MVDTPKRERFRLGNPRLRISAAQTDRTKEPFVWVGRLLQEAAREQKVLDELAKKEGRSLATIRTWISEIGYELERKLSSDNAHASDNLRRLRKLVHMLVLPQEDRAHVATILKVNLNDPPE